MDNKKTKRALGKIHPSQKPRTGSSMSRGPFSPSGAGDYGKRSNIRPAGPRHPGSIMNLLNELKAMRRRENRKNMRNHRRNIKIAGRNFDEPPIDDLGRYVEAELDYYKDDWEENRAAYTPAQSGSPGETPD